MALTENGDVGIPQYGTRKSPLFGMAGATPSGKMNMSTDPDLGPVPEPDTRQPPVKLPYTSRSTVR